MSFVDDRYESIHHIHSRETATEEDLRKLLQTFPVIDNHAHNLLSEGHAYGSSDHPFESITSEAQGHALHDHTHSTLAHMRGIKQLAELYRCPPTLQDVKAARYEWVRRDYEELIRKCFDGTHAIMMDDGLSPEVVEPVSWHRQFLPTCSRIVRIEVVAADLLEHLAHNSGFLKPGVDADWDKDQSEALLMRFNTAFRNQIRTLAQDPNVRGFKSVVCYRTGLDVGLVTRNVFRPHQSLTESSLLTSFHSFVRTAVKTHKYRIQEKNINDYLVVATCDVLDKLIDTEGESLPFQFHTGLGDNDIDLVKSNPAYMQPLIAAFPNVDFVILHSSYPYTREAGYLAANYANAWLDIGEVFPMLSRDGQESVLRHALELTPVSKILWSTDGHFYPETYYLANRQFRAALEKVLMAYVHAGDITIAQAVDITADVFFWNSNSLYKLDEERKHPQLVKACGRGSEASSRTLVNGGSRRTSMTAGSTTLTTSQVPSAGRELITHQISPNSIANETVPAVMMARDIAAYEAFMAANPHLKYIWVQLIDFTGTTRQRMIPIAQFRKHIISGKYPSMTYALPRLLQNDNGAKGASATGEFKMMFDLSTLSLNNTVSSPSANVQCWLMDDSGSPQLEHSYACARSILQRHLNSLETDYRINMIMGFEIEIVFVRPRFLQDGSNFEGFTPLQMVHHWSSLTYQQVDTLPMIEEIVEKLAEIDIHVPQFHAEAAPGQWEFPLPPSEPLKAIDMLYQARDVIRGVARNYGLKATLYPRPYDFTCGSASHAHFSINGPSDTVEKYADPFLGGILDHLPSILAFTLPLKESYARIQAGIWAGGEWITWGTQNRETPIRRIEPGHWELKVVDGIGNMYLSMCALVAAGLHGIEEDLELTLKDLPGDASNLTDTERKEYGITTRLPKQLEQSLQALDSDEVLREMLGSRLVDDYLVLKKAEMEMLDGFGEEKRRVWLMSRY